MRNYPNKILFICVTGMLIAGMAGAVYAKGYDWMQWQGPDQTGVSAETDWDAQALNRPLKINWKINVGPGFSNVATYDGMLYTLGYDKAKKANVLYAVDIASGKKRWQYAYKAKPGQHAGPKSSPVIDNGRVYTMGQNGDLLCNDSKTGKKIWERQIVKAFGAEKLRWGISTSVRVVDDLIIISAGSAGMALDKRNGKIAWKSKAGQGNYATPVSFSINGVTYAAIFGQKGLNLVEAKTGKLVWFYPWKTTYNIIASDPYVAGKRIFISSGYGNGCALIDFSTGKPEKVWQNKNVSSHFSTVFVQKGYIYAMDGNAGSDGRLTCLALSDGTVQWRAETGFGNMTAADGKIILLNERGDLFIVAMDPERYHVLSSKTGLLAKTCWTAPVLSHGNLYLRNNKGELVSLDLEK